MSQFHEERLRRSSIAIQIREPFEDFAIKMNRGRLTQVFDNLILNAEYWLREEIRMGRAEDGRIFVESRPPTIRIWDSGRGITPYIEPHLFEPFVTTKPSGAGRGLGLFICRQLLEASGCSISLSSERNEWDRVHIFSINLEGVMSSEQGRD